MSSLLTIKGAPDILIERCTKYTTINGDVKTLDVVTKAKIDEIKNKWSSQGRRVILFARKTLHKENILNRPNSGQFEDEVMGHARNALTLVGIVGIVDPPRDEIPSVVSILRRAGIRIFMVCFLNQIIVLTPSYSLLLEFLILIATELYLVPTLRRKANYLYLGHW